VAVVFALQNPAYIDVNLGPFLINGSTALILMVTFCIGVLVGILATTPSLIKRKRRIRHLEKGSAEPAANWSTSEKDIDTSSSRAYRAE
jgi:putative membrane protein